MPVSKKTTAIVSAFVNGLPLSVDGTYVLPGNRSCSIMMDGKQFAWRSKSVLIITDADNPTRTTKERINAILAAYNLGHVNQGKGEWWLHFPDGSCKKWHGCYEFNIGDKDDTNQRKSFYGFS